MADRGTRSSGAVASDVVVLVGANLERAPFGVRKADGGEERLGRRVGREEKSLICVSYNSDHRM